MKKIVFLSLRDIIYFKRKEMIKCFLFPKLSLLIPLLFIAIISFGQTVNQNTPIINGSGPFTTANLTARTSNLIFPVPDFLNVDNIKDASTSNAASVGLTGILGSWIEIDYSGGTFPQGSEVGFVLTKGLLSASLLGGVTISTHSTASGSGGVVSTSSVEQLIGLSIAGGKEKISFVSTGAGSFRRIRLTFSGLNISALTSILGSGASINVYNAEVLVPQTGTLSSTCNTTTSLSQAAFPAVAAYGTTSLVGAGGLAAADVAGILNQIQNVENITSSSTSDYANLSPVNASVAGEGYLSVKLLSGSVPKDYYAGFEIENVNGLLTDVNLLNGMRVEVLNSGAVVQSMSAFQILSASILSGGGSGRQTLGFVVTAGAFNEIRLVLTSGLLGAGASLGETRIFNAVVRNFCAPATPLTGVTVLANNHPSANGMTVAVNGANSGLANAGVLNTQSFAKSLGNLVDADPANYVSLSSTLGIGAGSTASVSVTTPNHTFVNDEYTGFVVKAASPLANVGLLTGITLSTYNNGNPTAVEQASVSNTLLQLNVLNALSVNGDVPPDAQVLYFKTTADFDEVRLAANNLLGVGNELQVYGAFVTANAALPVSFGTLTAVLEGNSLNVNWNTISETNNKEFIVEGSADGSKWVKLGTVASQAVGGNSDDSISYSFTKTVKELLTLSGFALIPALILVLIALMLFPSVKRKTAFWATPVLAIVLAFLSFSCNKSGDSYETGDQPIAYVRIAQVDKDGTTRYSKVVTVVKK